MIAGAVDFLLIYLLPFLVLLTVLVFVHEMGHYLVARWNGVRVEVFSIGFGPEIFGWTDKKQTRWKVAWVPLGGYVKFLGDMNATSAPDHEALGKLPPDQSADAFHNKNVWQRAAIVFAGPAANFIYAILVLTIVYVSFGLRLTPPEIGRVLPDSVAAQAGLQPGDVIRSVNGRGVLRFEDAMEEAVMHPNIPMTLTVERDGQTRELSVTPALRTITDRDENIHKFGDLGIYPFSPAIVGRVFPDSAAEDAGFIAGDHIVGIDGRPVDNFEQLQDAVSSSLGKTMRFAVERDGQRLELAAAARRQVQELGDGGTREVWLVGIQRAPLPLVKLSPLDAFGEAIRTCRLMLVRTFDFLGQMIGGRRGTEDLGGPIRIAQVSGQAAKGGIESFIMLSVLLSLNLGFINLLPIPVLDGGHLLFYVFEAIRGRPLTERMQEYALRFGFLMVLSLMVFVTWNDLANLRVFEYIAGLFS